MKLYLNLCLTLALCQLALALGPKMVCFYDASSVDREGWAQFTTTHLEIALPFCTHLIYGYAGINSKTFELQSLNSDRDIQRKHFTTITELKRKYPHIKFLLSVGGDMDRENPDKYIQLLEGGQEKYDTFVASSYHLLREYKFDGLDLAFQLPRNKPRKVHSWLGSAWKWFKKLFTGNFIVDKKAEEHKRQFTNLVTSLHTQFRPNNLMLTLTVLPNVNSTWYFDAPNLLGFHYINFVNLAAFDFTTPERNPEEADYTAPLYPVPLEGNRLSHYNVEYQVEYWISQGVPHDKINVGIATYGRAWKMTTDSKTEGLPIVPETSGPAEPGFQTNIAGLLDWAEICLKLPNPQNNDLSGADAPLRHVSDSSKKNGTYAFRPADDNNNHGIWISYDDPATASDKADFVKSRGLGGVALFDLSLDDFHGFCTGDIFPILRAIKYRLSSK